jgi:hypothetical protein
MTNQLLAEKIGTLLETGQRQTLDKNELQAFHSAFREKVAPFIDEHRERQRQAFEDVKDIALR